MVSPDFDIYINTSIQVAVRKGDGVIVQCFKRPDLIGRTKTAIYELREVVSTASQTEAMLVNKINSLVIRFQGLLTAGPVSKPQ